MKIVLPATPYLAMEEIDEARTNAQRLAERYIRRAGWVTTCDTPGSVWLWKKELDGKTYLVSFSDAEQFQRELDYTEMNKAHDPIWDDHGACIVCGSSPDDWESPHRRHVGDASRD